MSFPILLAAAALSLEKPATTQSRRAVLSSAAIIAAPMCTVSAAAPPDINDAAAVLRSVIWEDAAPFTREDFRRLDESDDALFYDTPKLVYHIDEPAVKAATSYYGIALLCSTCGCSVPLPALPWDVFQVA